MGQVVACANQKGGVGKTTTVVNLGAYLALAGKRVLIVDLDPQGNATSGLGVDRNLLERSMYEAVVDDQSILGLVVSTPVERLVLAPSAISLAGAEIELAGEDRRERRLASALEPVTPEFDYVLIDCPPSLGLLTVNALTAADAVLIPIQCEYYALEGLTQLIATVNLVRDHLNPDLAVKGVVLTMFDPRTNLSSQVSAEVRAHLGPAVYDAVIPRSVRLSEAPSYGLPIPLYRPDSKGAEAYASLAAEILSRDAGEATSAGSGHAVSGRATVGTEDANVAASHSEAVAAPVAGDVSAPLPIAHETPVEGPAAMDEAPRRTGRRGDVGAAAYLGVAR